MENNLIEYLKNNFSSDTEFTIDTPLLEENILDSFGIIDLICYIENSFSIVIPDDEFDINNFKDINSIIQLIQKLQ
ncbi:MAG: phosphopantetheine attachment site [Lachnospiraceae bacterium]|nr:phosphopantetheine attachment site [Lachnospiraceae bacterium]